MIKVYKSNGVKAGSLTPVEDIKRIIQDGIKIIDERIGQLLLEKGLPAPDRGMIEKRCNMRAFPLMNQSATCAVTQFHEGIGEYGTVSSYDLPFTNIAMTEYRDDYTFEFTLITEKNARTANYTRINYTVAKVDGDDEFRCNIDTIKKEIVIPYDTREDSDVQISLYNVDVNTFNNLLVEVLSSTLSVSEIQSRMVELQPK